MDQKRENGAAKMEGRAAGKQAQGPLESIAQKSKTLIYGTTGVVAAVVLLGGVILARSCEAQTNIFPTPQSTSTLAVVDKTETYRQILDQEVARLGIQRSQKEIDLWTQRGYFPSPSGIIAITPESQVQAARIIQSTLSLMSASENPRFRETTNYLRPLVTNREVRLGIPPIITSENVQRYYMITDIKIENGRLLWEIVMQADYLLNTANSIEQAAAIAHEAMHVIASRQFIKTLSPQLSEVQKREKDYERFEAERVPEEARAAGVAAQAIIFQYGLGERRFREVDLENAVNFIQAGNDASAPTYQRFVATKHLNTPSGR